MRARNPNSETLRAKPSLDPRLLLFWEAFNELSGSRPPAFETISEIPVSEILAYCMLCGFDDPVFRHELLTMVQALDRAMIALQSKKGSGEGRQSD